jgi:hypothetical protein
MTLDVWTELVSVNTSEEVLYRLDVIETIRGKNLHCEIATDSSSWVYPYIRRNDMDSTWRSCGEGADSGGGCNYNTDPFDADLETLWISAYVTLFSTEFDHELRVAIPSKPFDIAPDINAWMKLDVSDRDDGDAISCVMEGDGYDADMYIYANRKTSDSICVNNNFGSDGDCSFTLSEETRTIW